MTHIHYPQSTFILDISVKVDLQRLKFMSIHRVAYSNPSKVFGSSQLLYQDRCYRLETDKMVSVHKVLEYGKLRLALLLVTSITRALPLSDRLDQALSPPRLFRVCRNTSQTSSLPVGLSKSKLIDAIVF